MDIKPPPSVEDIIARRTAPVKEVKAKLTRLQEVAVWITAHVGSMGFFLIIVGWTAGWLGWNLLAPPALQFDPPMAFVFWLFISNVIQIMLMPLIMVGQNVQGAHSDARAEHDLAVNVKAEEEIEVILRHLEYQNALMLQIMERLEKERG
jgi:uncharacterized membrane protein